MLCKIKPSESCVDFPVAKSFQWLVVVSIRDMSLLLFLVSMTGYLDTGMAEEVSSMGVLEVRSLVLTANVPLEPT